MRGHNKFVCRRSPVFGHCLRRGDKRGGDDRHRRDAGAFQFDAVEHTARTTRPSIAYPGKGEIRLLLEQRDCFRGDTMA
jgi:hypothetical protein